MKSFRAFFPYFIGFTIGSALAALFKITDNPGMYIGLCTGAWVVCIDKTK